MIEIYAVNYTDENEDYVNEWTLIQEIPSDPDDDVGIVNPSIDIKIDTAETMQFTVLANTAFYNAFHQLTSYLRVDYDGTTVFYGRVLTIDTGYHGERKIQCEGPIAFLNDTYQKGSKENERSVTSIGDYLRKIIISHNANASDDHKIIYLGEVPGNYSQSISDEQKVTAENRKFGETSWMTTKAALENLKSYHGGFFRVRYDEYVDDIGQYGEGNIDLNDRIPVINPDGSISTELSITIKSSGDYVLIPTVINGEIVSDSDAIAYYNQNGTYLGKFDTADECEDYAMRLHIRQDWYYSNQPEDFKVLYLDWLEHYTSTTAIDQIVAIGKNVIDLNYITEVNNIFTAIIPLGHKNNGTLTIEGYATNLHGDNNYLRVDDIGNFYSDFQLNSGYHTAAEYHDSYEKYGLIFKTVDFPEANTKAELLTQAAKWIKDNYFGGIDSFTVSAIDMHLIGENEEPIMIGNRTQIRYVDDETVSRVLTCISIKLDLYNPEKNQYGFGIPSTSLNRNYSVTSKKSSSTPSPASKYTPPPDVLDEQAMWLAEVTSWLRAHQVWKASNGGVEGGPNASSYMNVFLRPSKNVDEEGVSKQWLWKPQIQSVTGGIVNFAKDSNGHPLGSWIELKKSEVTANKILGIGLVQYIKMEYGFDIRNGTASGFGVDMPTVITNDDGTTSIFSALLGTESYSIVQKLLDLAKEGRVMDIFEKDGTTISAWIDDLGDYHYYEKNPDGSIKTDDQGNPVELSVKQINDDVIEVTAQILTVEADYMQFKSASQSTLAYLEITANDIRSEVAASNSAIYSSILQTASSITSIVEDAEAGARTYTQQTASAIRTVITNTTNRTWIQEYDPTTEAGGSHEVKDHDMWIESTHQGSWDGADGFDWEHDEDFDWFQVQGAKIWGWANDKWELISDQQQTVSWSEVVQTAEYYARRYITAMVNDEGMIDVYQARLVQTAQELRSEYSAANSTVYSAIQQTASNIRLTVAQRPRTVTSATAPTSIDNRGLKEDDIWIESANQEDWDAALNLTWNDDYDFDWNELRNDKLHVYRNGQWVDLLDGEVILDEADIELERNRSRMYAHKVERMDGQMQSYYAELKVESKQIQSKVDENYGNVVSKITQTARQIRSEVTDRVNGLSSSITQTATQIRSEVSNSIAGLQSSITQEANRISLVVEGTGANAHIKPAQIVASINNGGSSVLIDADHVKIGGNVDLADVIGINSSTGYAVMKKWTLFNSDIWCNGNISLFSGSAAIGLTYSTLATTVKSFSISGNVLTLTRYDGTSETFSKATTLDPTWSGSVLTIAAKQTNGGSTATVASKTVGFGGSYGAHDIELGLDTNGYPSIYSGTQIDVPVKVLQQQGGGATTSRYTKSLRYNVSSLLQAKTVTSNGTITPDSSYIGLSSVVVNVTTTLDPTWSGSVLTISAKQNNATVASKTVGFGGSYGAHDVELVINPNGSPSIYSQDSKILNIPYYVGTQNSGGANPTSRYMGAVRSNISNLLQWKSVDTNGEVTPDSGYIGLSKVTVNVPTSTGSWSWNSQGYVDNTNNLPSGTKHQVNNLKSVIVNNRSKQGYIYFRILINGSYHVFYFADNGNGWTS